MSRSRYVVSLVTQGEEIHSGYVETLESKGIAPNLRHFFHLTGYDYDGLELHAGSANISLNGDIGSLDQALQYSGFQHFRLSKVRVILAPVPVNDHQKNAGFNLVTVIQRDGQTGWTRGGANAQCKISVTSDKQIAAVINDIICDISVANSPSVRELLSGVPSATSKSIFHAKADFARNSQRPSTRSGVLRLFQNGVEDGAEYASFFALNRTRNALCDEKAVLEAVGRDWDAFLLREYGNFFWNIDQAIEFIKKRASIRNRSWERVKPGGHISESALRDALKPSRIQGTGHYVLYYLQRNATPETEEKIQYLFSSPRKGAVTVLPLASYEQFFPFIRDGFVAPLRLFLKE